jgi:hypothetical protein
MNPLVDGGYVFETASGGTGSDAYQDSNFAPAAMYADAADSIVASSVRSECHDDAQQHHQHHQHQSNRQLHFNRMVSTDMDEDVDDDVDDIDDDVDEHDHDIADDVNNDDNDNDNDEIHVNKAKKRRTAIAGTAPVALSDYAEASNAASELQSRQMVEHLLQEFAPSVVLRALLASPHAALASPRNGAAHHHDSVHDAFRNSVSSFVQRTRAAAAEQRSLHNSGVDVAPPPTSEFFWNDSFQVILALDDGPTKFRKLRNLAHDFTHAASVYGRIIISERFLPVEQKTIKPLMLGGTAGGLKYICGGVMFKFCVDVRLSNGGWMYGGAAASDERASKSGGHELKSIINLLSLSPKDTTRVHFPMMAVVDYRGFRLLAESLLPIDRSTCIYGSPDGGATMHASDARLNASMRCLAQQLNLAEHLVGDVRIAGPGDVEGHIGRDGRFYLIDLARIFPPLAPLVKGRADRRHVFYELMRPEFVRNWTKQPLCSDAFTRWLERDPDAEALNSAVVEASRALYTKAIPNFALEVPSLLQALPSAAANERELERLFVQQIEAMLSRLHNRGINVRHLGLVRAAVAPQHWVARTKLMSEMTARALKCIVHLRLREKMRGLAFPGEEPYRQELIAYLNLVLGNHAESDVYWTRIFDGTEREGDDQPSVIGSINDVVMASAAAAATTAATAASPKRRLLHSFGPSFKYAIIAKFGPQALCAHMLDSSNSDLRSDLGMSAMISRLVGMLGIVFTESCLTELHLRPNSVRLVSADVVDTGVRVKHMGIVNQADARVLHLEAQERMKRGDRSDESNDVDRLLELARRLYVDALASMPDNFDILSGLGDVLFDLAMRHTVDDEKRFALLQEALVNYAESLRSKDFRNVGRRVLVRLVRVLCELASDANALSEAVLSYCNQAAVYADDALSVGQPSADGRPVEASLDGFIKHCIGAPRDLNVAPQQQSAASESMPLSQSLSRSQLMHSTELREQTTDGAQVVLTYTPPRLFVALLTTATMSERLRARLLAFGPNLRLTALHRLVRNAVLIDPDTGATLVDERVVERIDLSAFRHLSMPTIELAREMFPQCGEMWLLPSRTRGRNVFSLSPLRAVGER